MYKILSFFISISTLIVFISSSMKVKIHKNPLLHHQIKPIIEDYLKSTQPQSQINFIIDREVDSIFLEHILDGYSATYSVILNDSEDRLLQCNSYICNKMYPIVGLFKTSQNVMVNRWKVFYHKIWDPSVPIAIWISDQTNLDDVEELLKTFWQHNSINVIVIIPDILTNEKVIYGYDPFVIKTDKNRGEIYQIAAGDNLYPDKLKNLHGYPIPIAIYDHQPYATLKNFTELTDGSDVNYCKTLSQWMNFTINLKTASVDYSSYILILPNGSESTDVGDITTNRSDMLGNSMHWELNDWVEVDYTYPHWRSKVVVIVPRHKPLPGVSLLFKSGSGITLILIFSALCLLFIILYIKGDDNALLSTFSLLLHQTFRKISRHNPERIFCIAWIYWSLVLISSFQGKLVHDIAAPPYFHDMNTLRALVKSNLTLMTKSWEHKILNNSNTNLTRQLLQQTIIDMNATNCAIRMIKHKNVACAVDGIHADFIIAQVRKEIYKIRKLNRKKLISREIHIMKQPLFYYWRTYIVKKYFVYLKKINKLSTRLVEFGIMNKWTRDDLSKNVQMQFINNDPEPLDLRKTRNIFIILICGNFIATFSFLIEVIYYKLQHVRIKTKQCEMNKNVKSM